GWGRRAALSGLLASLVGIAVAVAGLERNPGEPASGAPSAAARHEPFTQARLDALIAAHRPAFVNVTAAWCITCLVNERAGLAGAGVEAAFAAKGITYLKGDWPRRNPEINPPPGEARPQRRAALSPLRRRRPAHRAAADPHARHGAGRGRAPSRPGAAP